MADDRLNLADLVKAIGAKRRTVQLWAEAGVLFADPHSERAGSGTHRSFGVDEVVIGCIINAFALNGMQIGKLLMHSKQLRIDLAVSAGIRREIRMAIDNDTRVYLASAGNDTIIFTRDEVAAAMPIALGRLGANNPSLIVVHLNTCLASAGEYLR